MSKAFDAKRAAAKGYTREDWDGVDSPELTDDELAGLRRSPGRPKSSNPKIPVSIRLSPEVVAHFKAGGPGWQTRIDAELRKIVGGK